MDTRRIRSTSRSTAEVEELVLRSTGTTRLIFRPMLVDNKNDPASSVKGVFIFQKKGRNDTWENVESPPLSALKKDDIAKLDLHSAEVKTLFDELASLYSLYDQSGIPRGERHFVEATSTLRDLAAMSDDDLVSVIGDRGGIGAEALSRLIRWATAEKNFSLLFDRLEELGEAGLSTLNSAVGIAAMKRALLSWSENRTNSDEEFWQSLLAQQAYVLEQLFHVPIVIVGSKAFVGGKAIDNTGGKLIDFLVKNEITQSLALIEIKTPTTKLLASEYRSGIYNVSNDLAGSVQQILAYKDELSRSRDSLLRSGESHGHVLDPTCIVLIGHAERELDAPEKKRAFELFRQQLKDVQIVTYDEMFHRTKRLVTVLERGIDSQVEG